MKAISLRASFRQTVPAVLVLVLGSFALLQALPADAAPKAAGTGAKVTTTTAARVTSTTAAPATTSTSTTVAPTTTTPAAVTTTTEAPTTTVVEPVAATTTEAEPSTPAPAPAPAGMLLGTRKADPTDPFTVAAMNAWQGKTNAVVQTYVRSTWLPSVVVGQLDAIWNGGSVPSVSYDLQVTNPQVLAGAIDPSLQAFANAFKTWLAGPDGAYGNGDDRRAYFRPAWEANGNWYRWSPCYYAGGTGSVADYQAMWRKLHGTFDALGVDRTRLAWIYSVNSGDKVAACSAEALYPGDAYVDWTGIDGYTTSTGSASQVFEPMVLRLRALAPGKPVSINEWGADSLVAGGKPAWIAGQFAAAHALGIRMNVVFNIDKERDWAVLGGAKGDETFTFGGRTMNAWSSYRAAVADARVVGADAGHPRLLTDAQFLGQ